MRRRAMALTAAVLFGVVTAFAASASALTVGPISVNVPIPKPVDVPESVPVNVTVPKTVRIGPIVFTTPALPTASVTVAPDKGVAVGVTIPPALGPIPLLPNAPHSVQVTVGAGSGDVGVGVSAPAAPGSASTPVAPVNPPPSVTPALPSAPSLPTTPQRPVAAPVIGIPAVATAPAHATRSPSGSTRSDAEAPVAGTPSRVSSTVNASLQRPAPLGTWALVRDVAGHFELWLALFAILAIARWALVGLVRDARRRAVSVSSS